MERLRYPNIALAIILLLNNAITTFIYKNDSDFIVNIMISLIIIIISTINIRRLYSPMYILVGFLVATFGSNDNFSAVFLIFIGLYLYDNKQLRIVSSILLICFATVKYSLNGFNISSYLNMISAYLYFSYVLYILFWPGRSLCIVNRKGLTPEQEQTVKCLLQGLKHEDAAKKLNIERKTYSARVSSLRKRYNVKNEVQLTLALIEDGIISSNELAKAKMPDNPFKT